MDWAIQLIQFILHIDKHLAVFIANYGVWTYAALFLIVFCETGLVVTPILPGDSLLFATGALAAGTSLNIAIVVPLLICAALLGDTVNYTVGRFLGPKLFCSDSSRLFNKQYLAKTHAFYEKYGPKAIIIARFVPIVRTFVPFVAGVANMGYRRFISYSIFAAILWVSVVTYAGFWFGGLDVVREHFSLAVMAVIFVSILPAIFEVTKPYLVKNKAT